MGRELERLMVKPEDLPECLYVTPGPRRQEADERGI
jgi:hypothetical protein